MQRDTDRCTLDPGRTALALRGVSKPASYPFVERHLWRRRAAGLFVALKALRCERSQREREADDSVYRVRLSGSNHGSVQP